MKKQIIIAGIAVVTMSSVQPVRRCGLKDNSKKQHAQAVRQQKKESEQKAVFELLKYIRVVPGNISTEATGITCGFAVLLHKLPSKLSWFSLMAKYQQQCALKLRESEQVIRIQAQDHTMQLPASLFFTLDIPHLRDPTPMWESFVIKYKISATGKTNKFVMSLDCTRKEVQEAIACLARLDLSLSQAIGRIVALFYNGDISYDDFVRIVNPLVVQ